KDKKEVAEGTMAFYFEKPAGFEFRAGQTIDLSLINPSETDEKGITRAYTIAAAPFEDNLMITTRIRDSAFKRILNSLSLGSKLNFDGPFGSLILHNNISKPAVFLTGGIGITPFRSIILQASHDELPHKLFLFYSSRRPEDAPFLEELTNLKNPNFQFISTMTQMEKSRYPWEGQRGYINQTMLSKYVDDLSAPIYYVTGPPQMVTAMYQMLVKAGVDSDNIRTEEFAGY
ncbi:MAG TPA: FAD-dependent oxidoreductase, partial [Candidatus Paceibacterota bacterium]|nr:FAD-dependent oxidoreductase [Candidatus Paceibacterota bacterium]